MVLLRVDTYTSVARSGPGLPCHGFRVPERSLRSGMPYCVADSRSPRYKCRFTYTTSCSLISNTHTANRIIPFIHSQLATTIPRMKFSIIASAIALASVGSASPAGQYPQCISQQEAEQYIKSFIGVLGQTDKNAAQTADKIIADDFVEYSNSILSLQHKPVRWSRSRNAS